MKTLETIKDEVAREFQKNPNFIGWSGLINSSKVKVMDRVCERYAAACVEEEKTKIINAMKMIPVSDYGEGVLNEVIDTIKRGN